MNLYFATVNPGKVNAIKKEFESHGMFITPAALEIPEPRSSDVREIAIHKVLHAYQQLKAPVFAMDAGFYIDSLNGFPRAFVNFALETIGLDGLLTLAHGKDRSCEFQECIAYMDEKLKAPETFIGKIPGLLSHEKRGEKKHYHWSELSTIFVPENYDKTLAEMDEQEYVAWQSMRTAYNSSRNNFLDWLLANRQA